MSHVVKVYVGNNVDRYPVNVDSATTLRAVLAENNIDYTRGSMVLDGATLRPGDLDKTFDDFNIGDKCFLLNVVKADNA